MTHGNHHPSTNTINGLPVRAVPRLYDPSQGKVTPGSWWYPEGDGIVLRCSRVKGDEHTMRFDRNVFDDDGVLDRRYSHIGCTQEGCDSDLGRVWLVDFRGP